MIAFIAARLGMSTLLVKIIGSGLILVSVLLGLRVWGNKQWQKGNEAGRVDAIEYLENQKKAEWAAKELQLKQAAATLGEERRLAADDRAAADARVRSAIAIEKASRETLSQAVILAKRNEEVISATIKLIPATQLDDAMRIRSRELADAFSTIK